MSGQPEPAKVRVAEPQTATAEEAKDYKFLLEENLHRLRGRLALADHAPYLQEKAYGPNLKIWKNLAAKGYIVLDLNLNYGMSWSPGPKFTEETTYK